MIGKNAPKAILVNSDDWGFGHFVLDDGSIKVFEEKLSKVQNKIDRAVVIGQLICMMRQIEYSRPADTVVNQIQLTSENVKTNNPGNKSSLPQNTSKSRSGNIADTQTRT